MRLDDPELVREEYASETGLLGGRAACRRAQGPDALEVLFQTISAPEPTSLLEVRTGQR